MFNALLVAINSCDSFFLLLVECVAVALYQSSSLSTVGFRLTYFRLKMFTFVERPNTLLLVKISGINDKRPREFVLSLPAKETLGMICPLTFMLSAWASHWTIACEPSNLVISFAGDKSKLMTVKRFSFALQRRFVSIRHKHNRQIIIASKARMSNEIHS